MYEGKTKMYVQLYDEDAKREDLISEGTVDLATVIKDGEQDGKNTKKITKKRETRSICSFSDPFPCLDWFQLTYKNRKAGEIYLEITFYSAASEHFGQFGLLCSLLAHKKRLTLFF